MSAVHAVIPEKTGIQENELPKGWVMTTLGKVTQSIEKVKPADQPQKEILYLDIGGIDKATNSVTDYKRYLGKDAPSRAQQAIKKGDVAFASVRPYLKNIAIVPNDLDGQVGSTGFCFLRAVEGVHNKYIYYWVISNAFINDIIKYQKGSSYPAVTNKQILERDIPLAPLEQQKHIVAKIEELFSHIDAGIEALKKAKQLLKQYRQSVLKAAVIGELLGKPFPSEMYKSIHHGLVSLGQGWSPKCARELSPSEDVWGVIKTTAVQSLEYLQEENKRLPDNLEPRPQLEIVSGDILVTRAGPRVRVGVCCLVKETRKKLMICDKVYRLRPNSETILPEFLEIVLNAPQVQKEIERLKTGISDSGVNLTQKRFVELKIPYPSIDDQKRLISLVYEKTESIARLENELETHSIKAEKNKQSILASAFSGKV